MNIKMLCAFIFWNLLNVALQTGKSIATVKGGKWSAALWNAVAYGLYTYIVILMVGNLPVWVKATIIGGCNLVGVYIVKTFEQRLKKDKIWRIEATVKNANVDPISEMLKLSHISYTILPVDDTKSLFFIYATSQKESEYVHTILHKYNAKYFISENREF